MRAVVGIGNPGRQYERTRHNLGWLVIDELVRPLGTEPRRAHEAEVWSWRLPPELGGDTALVLKPLTFVNGSGASVQSVMAMHRLAPQDVLVVVDDLALPLGHLRLRDRGSAGGHNGLRDIEARIGQAYPRLRLGMGPLPPGMDQVRFVLSAFSSAEEPVVQDLLTRAAACVRAWLAEGTGVACRYNGPPPGSVPPPRPAAPRPPPATPTPAPPPPAAGSPEPPAAP